MLVIFKLPKFTHTKTLKRDVTLNFYNKEDCYEEKNIMHYHVTYIVVPVSAKAKPRLNKKTLYMSTADKVKLKVLNNKKKVKWTSSNKKVARVSKKGTVTPHSFGKTTITAKFGKKKLKCKVYVKEEEVWFDDAGHEVSVMPTSKRKARIKIRIGKDKFTKTVKKTQERKIL